MKKVLVYIIYGLLFFVSLWGIQNLEWIQYGLNQGKGQIHLIRSAIPVKDIYKDASQPDSLIRQLRYLDSVKAYAHEILQLKNSEIYSSIYDQKGEPVMFVVVAAPEFSLESYSWSVPLVGTFPYLGFFKKELAIAKRDSLLKEGLDARIRIANGWSTMGYIENPLLSENLKKSKGDLANLIIHEITHETVFFRHNAQFNENFASFIGDAGARMLLKDFYGDSSYYFNQYVDDLNDYMKLSDYLIRNAELLNEMYLSWDSSMPDSLKRELKQERIDKIILGLKKLNFKNPDYGTYFDEFKPDNSFFMSFINYRSNQNEFYDTLNNKFKGDLPSYIIDLKNRIGG